MIRFCSGRKNRKCCMQVYTKEDEIRQTHNLKLLKVFKDVSVTLQDLSFGDLLLTRTAFYRISTCFTMKR